MTRMGGTFVGLPYFEARAPGAKGSAEQLIIDAAQATGLPDDFAACMWFLGWNEANMKLGLPARNYNNPPGKRRISAWGVFQWQDRHVKKYFNLQYAWQMTIAQETAGVMPIYAEKFRKYTDAFGNGPLGILSWHASVGSHNWLVKWGGKRPQFSRLAAKFPRPANKRPWAKVIQDYMKHYNARRLVASKSFSLSLTHPA
jgi:hypothetical protein